MTVRPLMSHCGWVNYVLVLERGASGLDSKAASAPGERLHDEAERRDQAPVRRVEEGVAICHLISCEHCAIWQRLGCGNECRRGSVLCSWKCPRTGEFLCHQASCKKCVAYLGFRTHGRAMPVRFTLGVAKCTDLTYSIPWHPVASQPLPSCNPFPSK